MNLADIKKLLKLVEESKIEEIEIQQDDFQIRITKSSGIPVQMQAVPQAQPVAVPQLPVQPAAVPEVAPVEAGGLPDNLIEICSPMVGTFYNAPAPDADNYVNVGDMIQPGKILCIVEAMKLMNEIEAEISGKVVKILVENAQPVEYNQPLYLVEKV